MSLKLADKISLTIHDIAFGGEGVGRVDEFVVFVPFVLVGEMVEAEITEVKKRFRARRLLRVVQPSPERVAPECRYFAQCGGCQYQHIGLSRPSLRIKHKQICDLFQRIGRISPAENRRRCSPAPQPYGYRNRIMIRSQWDKFKQGLNIGYIRADNRLVVDIEECRIAEPALNEQIRDVRANPPPKGGLKVVLRVRRRLGGAARFVFPEQFLPAAQAGRGRCAACARRRREHPGGCSIAASAFSASNGRCGGVVRRSGIRSTGHPGRASERDVARTIPGVRDVRESLQTDYPEIQVDTDREKAGFVGRRPTTPRRRRSTQRSATSHPPGVWIDANNGQSYYVVTFFDAARVPDTQALGALAVRISKMGNPVLLGAYGNVHRSVGAVAIERDHLARVARVLMQTEGRDLGSAGDALKDALKRDPRTRDIRFRFVSRVWPWAASHADTYRLSQYCGHQRCRLGRRGAPSQFMEHYAWLPEVLARIGAHARSGEPIPEAKRRQLIATRSFHAGLQTLRQVEFALFDMRLHAEYDPARGANVYPLLAEVRAEVAVTRIPEWNRYPHSFTHIFAGGYAAGYYSYKWAEVLAADAFAAFRAAGPFDRATAERFLDCILARGGSRDPLEAFVEFRGRKPEIGPLLELHGIAPSKVA